ncbi:MAG: 2OG-Fe(II) oxygenase [Bacteroidota bacterium]|nr:2OG-Fe(II) oxygenase [Bacteroidota bacterium]
MLTSSPQTVDIEGLRTRIPELSGSYQSPVPYPHIVIDNFLDPAILENCIKEFDQLNNSDGWINYVHFNEKKRGLNKLELLPESIKQTIHELNTPSFLEWLSQLTGIKNLQKDDMLEGGGIHQSTRGGYLNIHADFTVHPHHRHWQRRINLLVYLNKDWQEAWGGQLELWDRNMKGCEQKILPIFNRCVIFNTDPDSYHGHPDPMTCPEGYFRRSIALYYYTIEENPLKRSTHYVARPEEKNKEVMVKLDNFMIATYTRLKGILGSNDQTISRILRFFSGKK